MPVYRKGKGSWKAVVVHHGARRDWIVRGSQKDAELDPRVVPTFSDFCLAQYRPYAEIHLKGNTWYKRSSLLSFLMEHFGSLKLTEIHARAVDDYKRKRREAGLKNVPSTTSCACSASCSTSPRASASSRSPTSTSGCSRRASG